MVHMVATSETTRGLPVAPRGGEEWTTEMLKLLPDDGLRYEIIDGIPHREPGAQVDAPAGSRSVVPASR